MHIIIDANCCANALKPSPEADFIPVMKAILGGKRKLAVGGSKQKKEYMRSSRAWKYIRLLDQAGKAFLVSDSSVDSEQGVVESMTGLESDDPHIIALARVSGARVLVSLDQALHADFCNAHFVADPRGRVYQNTSHAHLVRGA